jgi:aminopeptidase N
MYARRAFPGFVGYEPRYLEKEFTTTGHDAHETSLLWWTYTLHGIGPGSFQWTEGFGDYAEILYDEVYHKPIPKIFQRFRREYLATPVDQDLPYSDLRGSTPQKFIHGKYPWLLHIVRSVVGDSAFRNALKLVFTRFRYRTFTMNEFISALEDGCGQSLQWWREEWLERKGVPTIAMDSHILKRGSGYVITCTLEQRGNTYHLPLAIGIESSLGIRVEKVKLNEKRAVFTFESKEEPTRILLDPQGWVLMNVTSQE